MKVSLTFLVTFLLNAQTLAKFRKCATKEGELLEVSVSGCPDLSQACKFGSGSNVTISVNFLPDTDATRLRVTISAQLFPIVKRLTDVFLDACEAVANCPVHKSGTYKVNYTQHIPKKFPKIPVKWSYKLRADDHLDSIACFTFDVGFV